MTMIQVSIQVQQRLPEMVLTRIAMGPIYKCQKPGIKTLIVTVMVIPARARSLILNPMDMFQTIPIAMTMI